jgi:Zn-dependent protease
MENSLLARLPLVFVELIPFFMAIVFHEVAHAVVAKRFGDTTAEDLGRMTLNPIPHLDPIGTVALPVINMLSGFPVMFGWAKPVPVNFNRLRPYRKGLFLTALAGPAINFVIGFIASFVLVAFALYVPESFYLYAPFRMMADAAIQINFGLAVFNLLPIPPLDGSKMLESFLSFENTRKFERLQSYSFFILLALLWTGALSVLAIPINILRNTSISIWTTLFQI